MDREADQIKIKQILTATIASLCNNSLTYSAEITIQGLLGITIDHKDVLLVSINETLGNNGLTNVGQTEPTQSCSLQLVTTDMEQNFIPDNTAYRHKQAENISKSTPVSKKRVSTY